MLFWLTKYVRIHYINMKSLKSSSLLVSVAFTDQRILLSSECSTETKSKMKGKVKK